MNKVSHNTMSYLKPIHWYNRIFIRWSKCQSKTLQEQYESGIRWFDIRINKINNNWNIVHNKVIYTNDLQYVLSYLNSTKDMCHIRLMYDDRRNKSQSESDSCTKDFKTFISKIKVKFKNIDIYETITYWNWTYLNKDNKYTDIEKHSSVSLPLWKYILYGTKRFALKNNSKNIEKYKYNENCLLYLDFI